MEDGERGKVGAILLLGHPSIPLSLLSNPTRSKKIQSMGFGYITNQAHGYTVGMFVRSVVSFSRGGFGNGGLRRWVEVEVGC